MHNNKMCFTCCSSCKNSLCNSSYPKWANCNGNLYETPPKVLTDLTEAELAFLTPIKTYSYCFIYTGNKQKQL